MRSSLLAGSLAVMTMGLVAGCGDLPSGQDSQKQPAQGVVPAEGSAAQKPITPAAAGWGVIRGRLVFAGASLPERVQLKIEKDAEHCLSKGPLYGEAWVVNPQNRGVRWVTVFLKPAKGSKLPIHDSLKDPPKDPAVLDQPVCAFEPHVLAIREGQKLLAKNPAPVAHNVMITGFRNSSNVQIPPGQSSTFALLAEQGAVRLACGAHPWMAGHVWIFEHPYFAVTDADGTFEIKLAPAGSQTLVVWHEAAAYLPDAKGRVIEVKADGVTDLGEIAVKPKE